MIDSHCHLADRKFRADLSKVVKRSHAAGVDRMIAIADSLPEAEECRKIAEKFDQIFYTVGVHPHHASQWSEAIGREFPSLLDHPKCVAVGEIGLDYHYMDSPKEDQLRAFRDQAAIAKGLGRPIVVHNRDSIDDLLEVVRELRPPAMVLHCCTERWEDVRELVDGGYLLSFTGIATYPKSTVIRETIKHCPLTQMMVETDAPYLAPESKRGERNEPAFVTEVAALIAELKGISYEEVDRVTTKNALEFFRLRP